MAVGDADPRHDLVIVAAGAVPQRPLQVIHHGQDRGQHRETRSLHSVLALPRRLLLVVFQIGGGMQELLPVALGFLFIARHLGPQCGQLILRRPGLALRLSALSAGRRSRVLTLVHHGFSSVRL